jgi:hypothetical protein
LPFNLSYYYLYRNYPPAKTLLDPAATEVQPDIPSPTLPQPLPFTFTVDDPEAIPAACAGQGGLFGGRR